MRRIAILLTSILTATVGITAVGCGGLDLTMTRGEIRLQLPPAEPRPAPAPPQSLANAP